MAQKPYLMRTFARLKLKDAKMPSQALAELAQMPQNKPLLWRIYARDFIKRLDERVGACTDSAFVKRGIFNIRAKSTVHFAELKHESVVEYIRESLAIYAKKRPLSEFDKVQSVKILPPLRLVRDERCKNGVRLNAEPEEIPLKEQSKGVFKNPFSSDKLKERFEKLRGAICARGERLGFFEDLKDIEC